MYVIDTATGQVWQRYFQDEKWSWADHGTPVKK
jgi:hypothetical protein